MFHRAEEDKRKDHTAVVSRLLCSEKDRDPFTGRRGTDSFEGEVAEDAQARGPRSHGRARDRAVQIRDGSDWARRPYLCSQQSDTGLRHQSSAIRSGRDHGGSRVHSHWLRRVDVRTATTGVASERSHAQRLGTRSWPRVAGRDSARSGLRSDPGRRPLQELVPGLLHPRRRPFR